MQSLRGRLWSWPALALISFGAALLSWPGMLPNLFFSDGFMPHGHCYLWTPSLVRLHVTSDLLIGVAYVAISVTLAYLVNQARQDIPFSWMFLCFGVFIISCGFTHFMEVWTVWNSHYWLAGFVKLVTASASVATALLLPRLVPAALELGRAARQSEEHKAALEKRNSELEAFGQLAAHDLRAPMRRIGSFAELLERHETISSSGKDHLEHIKTNAKRMASLVEALLASSRLAALPVRRVGVDVSALAERLLDELRSTEPNRRVETAVQPGITVSADKVLLESILTNLLSNAWKYTRDTSAARIELTSHKGAIVVKDNGIGFGEGDLPKLFRPFHRLRTDAEFEGSGVGLSCVRTLVEKHGGTITAQGKEGQGAIFIFTLSRHAEKAHGRRSA